MDCGLSFVIVVWVLGVWVLGVLVLGFGFWVLGFGFWFLGFGFWVLLFFVSGCFGFWVFLSLVFDFLESNLARMKPVIALSDEIRTSGHR